MTRHKSVGMDVYLSAWNSERILARLWRVSPPDTNGLLVRQLGFQFHPLIERGTILILSLSFPPLSILPSLILQPTDFISFAAVKDRSWDWDPYAHCPHG